MCETSFRQGVFHFSPDIPLGIYMYFIVSWSRLRISIIDFTQLFFRIAIFSVLSVFIDLFIKFNT